MPFTTTINGGITVTLDFDAKSSLAGTYGRTPLGKQDLAMIADELRVQGWTVHEFSREMLAAISIHVPRSTVKPHAQSLAATITQALIIERLTTLADQYPNLDLAELRNMIHAERITRCPLAPAPPGLSSLHIILNLHHAAAAA